MSAYTLCADSVPGEERLRSCFSMSEFLVLTVSDTVALPGREGVIINVAHSEIF